MDTEATPAGRSISQMHCIWQYDRRIYHHVWSPIRPLCTVPSAIVSDRLSSTCDQLVTFHIRSTQIVTCRRAARREAIRI